MLKQLKYYLFWLVLLSPFIYISSVYLDLMIGVEGPTLNLLLCIVVALIGVYVNAPMPKDRPPRKPRPKTPNFDDTLYKMIDECDEIKDQIRKDPKNEDEFWAQKSKLRMIDHQLNQIKNLSHVKKVDSD